MRLGRSLPTAGVSMSYDGEYDASEYPDGIHAPRLGYRGAREMAELREAKDEEIGLLSSVVKKMAERFFGAPAHLEPPLQRMRVEGQIDQLNLTPLERDRLKKIMDS